MPTPPYVQVIVVCGMHNGDAVKTLLTPCARDGEHKELALSMIQGAQWEDENGFDVDIPDTSEITDLQAYTRQEEYALTENINLTPSV